MSRLFVWFVTITFSLAALLGLSLAANAQQLSLNTSNPLIFRAPVESEDYVQDLLLCPNGRAEILGLSLYAYTEEVFGEFRLLESRSVESYQGYWKLDGNVLMVHTSFGIDYLLLASGPSEEYGITPNGVYLIPDPEYPGEMEQEFHPFPTFPADRKASLCRL